MATILGLRFLRDKRQELVTLARNNLGGATKTQVATAVVAAAGVGYLAYTYLGPIVSAEHAKLRAALEGDGFDPPHVETLIEESHVVPHQEFQLVPFRDRRGLREVNTEVDPNLPVRRRIRAGCRGKFMRLIVSAVKCRLGTPKQTEANRRAIMRVAREEMKEYNLRPSNQATVLPLIVEAVFVPDQWELEAAQMGASILAQGRRLASDLCRYIAGHPTSC